MSTTVTFKTIDGQDGSLTYDGGDIKSDTPAGAVLRLMVAILKKDQAECRKQLVSTSPADGTPPTPPASHATTKLGEPTFEGPDKAVVPTDSTLGDQEQSLPFVVVKESAGWKVDMNETMERVMGPMMAAMREGMEQIGEALGSAMSAIGEGIAEGLGMTQIAPDEPPTDPDLLKFWTEVKEMIGVKWHLTADRNAFDSEDPALLGQVLDELLKGVHSIARGGGAGIAYLEAVKTLRLARGHGEPMFDRDGTTLTYMVGTTDGGAADYFKDRDSARPLYAAIEGVLG